ncbi:N-acetyltransferase [Streptomyces chryseus]|uniref:N-acetyltransferase n=1 Tax=Streptomyces chryseus TaxID=68186 RepID=A0ABQ3DLP4_9ACTN|nr:N-acetyltransferase [Streptomyces chryseus]
MPHVRPALLMEAGPRRTFLPGQPAAPTTKRERHRERERIVELVLRTGRPEDAAECGRICYAAFSGIALEHGFPSDIPGAEVAAGMFLTVLDHPGFYSVVAELDGRIVGSNFLDERSPVVGVGPITVDPAVQNGGVGRRLMDDVMRRAAERRVPGVRLLQSGYHARSFALYAGLGFEFRETVACVQGPPIGGTVDGYEVRPATDADLAACNEVCRRVHGTDRGGELADALQAGTARVSEHGGRITGYATDLSFFAHAVGESTEDIRALIAGAPAFGGPGILVPASNSVLLRWCLRNGLKVQQLMSLMTTGLYSEPAGAYLPSVLY